MPALNCETQVSRHPRGLRVEMRATLGAGCGGALENRRDLLNLVKLAHRRQREHPGASAIVA